MVIYIGVTRRKQSCINYISKKILSKIVKVERDKYIQLKNYLKLRALLDMSVVIIT